MTEQPRHDEASTPKRFRTLRFNPLREVLPLIAVIVGLFLAVRGIFALGANGDPTFAILGPVLIAIGIAVFFINRWQAKRGT